MIATYQGKNLEDMTKAELIEAVIELGQLSEQNSMEHIRQLKVLSGN